MKLSWPSQLIFSSWNYMVHLFLQRNNCEHKRMLYHLLYTLIIQGCWDKAWRLIRKVGKSTFITENSLYYATLWRAFRNCFFFQNFPRVFINTMIVKTISFWIHVQSGYYCKYCTNILLFDHILCKFTLIRSGFQFK